jgi:hypothetical protein
LGVYEWDPVTVQRFEQFLKAEEQRRAADARTAEVGDMVETPDGRRWLVVRCPPSDLVDLQREESTLSVPREFVRVLVKAGRSEADQIAADEADQTAADETGETATKESA